MVEEQLVSYVEATRFACDGSGEGISPALGHPRVWLEIDPKQGTVTCGYCDRQFILSGGVADTKQPSETIS